jgi:choline dehydrogenase
VYRGREVILSGGTYGSAAILLRSGVGPADELTALGIAMVADLPVGRRLRDHAFLHTAYALDPGHVQPGRTASALLWTASSEAAPGELDLHIAAVRLPVAPFSPTGGAFLLSTAVVQPESVGTLKLASRNPDDAPLIDSNFLATGRDARRMLEGVKLSRAIARTPSFVPFLAGELLPGEAVDDNGLATFIPSAVTVYGHPTSTVPMGGPGDPGAVVDSVGAVKGLSGLRVVDASIIPEIPSAATNLTVIMLAERIYQRVYEA